MRVTMMVSAALIALALGVPAKADTAEWCYIFEPCWHEETRRKPRPRVKGYVKRNAPARHKSRKDFDDDDDRDPVICHDRVRAVGSQWATEGGAMEQAEKSWMEQVRWRYGESAMSIEAAKDFAKRCSRSSIGEIANQVLHRCEVSARPCRPVFESK